MADRSPAWEEASQAHARARAQVLVEVEGGIARTTTFGDVDVIVLDWDNVKEGDSAYIEVVIYEAGTITDKLTRARVTNILKARLASVLADEEV